MASAKESKLQAKLKKTTKILADLQETFDATEEYQQEKITEYEDCMTKLQVW